MCLFLSDMAKSFPLYKSCALKESVYGTFNTFDRKYIVLIALGGARQDARDTKRKADLEIIRAGLELYKSDCGKYPPAPLSNPLVGDNSTGCPNTNTYIFTVPSDPVLTQSYSYTKLTDYTYVICTILEDTSSANGVTSNCGNCGTVADPLSCNHGVPNP